MKLEIGIGAGTQPVEIPDANVMDVLAPNEVEVTLQGEAAVEDALRRPIGTPRVGEIVKPGEKIAIVTSDITRPLPSYKVLPPLLRELDAAGIDRKDITVVFALGSHRAHTEGEMRRLVGDAVYNSVRCVDSDPADFVHLGETSLGTPVDVTRAVAQADRRICLANLEYHYFAGYSGGAKSIMPGVSTRAAIQSNHSRMVSPDAAAGKLEGNPVRMDLEESIRYCPIDFIVNVVLDEHKEIIHAVAGHYVEAHRQGCKFLDCLYLKQIPARADIVLVSQGGAPKDLNLYQTQKALDNAKHAVRQGGVIILVGSCKEGLGEEVFEEWMTTAKTPQSLIDRIQSDFQLGGHKAAAIALVLQNADIFLVSHLEDDFVRSLFFQPYPGVQQALDAAFARLGDDAKVLVMPYGGSTLPMVR